MKPAFALSLSFDGITLLHRAAGGWRRVGSAALESDDLSGELAKLRAKAEELEPGRVRSKLILPTEQVRYLSIDTGTFEGEARDRMVRAAVGNATPYAIEELAFDTCHQVGVTHVAAVARETLAEAEAFAAEHDFGPVSFVAVPHDKPFLGEPWFGEARGASALTGGRPVDADGIAVVEIGPTDRPEPKVEARKSRARSETQAQPAAPPAPRVEPAVPEPEPELEPVGPAEADPEPAIGFSSRRRHSPTVAPADPGPAAAAASPPARRVPALVAALAESRDEEAWEDEDSTEPQVTELEPEPAETPEAPEITFPKGLVTAPRLDIDEPGDPDLETEAEEEPESKPDLAAAGFGTFFSRRLASRRDTVRATAEPDEPVEAFPAAPPPSQAAPIPYSPIVAANTGVVDEETRMTVFGARHKEEVGTAPRHLGLILTAALLFFLAAVALWATLFLDDGLAGLLGPGDDATQELIAIRAGDPAPDTGAEDPVTASLPDADTSPASPPELTDTDRAVLDALRDDGAEDPESPADADTAALEPADGTLSLIDPEAAADGQTGLDADLSDGAVPEIDPTLYAATGIWPNAPATPEAPGLVSLDDVFVGSIDHTDLSQDAVALPELASLDTDIAPELATVPPVPGTRYELDSNGLVVATPEGAATPGGYTVIAGSPPLKPPATPVRFEEQPETDEGRDRLALLRPAPRPGNLVERAERTQLGGLTRNELSDRRPKERPQSVQEAAEQATETAEEAPPTAQAVALSVRPDARPGNFGTIVAAAVRAPAPQAAQPQARQQPQPDEIEEEPVVATVAPRIPSSTSVARQATLDNAINLRQVNLIGVYGTPANRRALVRLPSGRYKKVRIGDSVDGGRVVAIGDSELRYQKGGRNMTLKIPSG